MTEIEQEHAQLIDINQERLNRIEKDVADLHETVMCLMTLLTAHFDKKLEATNE